MSTRRGPRKVRGSSLSRTLCLLFIPALLFTQSAFAQSRIPGQEDQNIKIDYEDRLRFFMDQKSRNYLAQMLDSETQLLQMIRNLHAEVKERGIPAVINDDPAFQPLYKDIDNLISEYNSELDEVIGLMSEIGELEQSMDDQARYGMAEQFANISDSLGRAIEHRKLHRLMPKTNTEIAGMLKEYNVELDSLLGMYSKLSKLEDAALRQENEQLQQRIRQQKRQLGARLAVQDSSHAVDPELTDALMREASELVSLLSNLEKLQKRAIARDPEFITEAEAVKREMVSKIDSRILKLFGYPDYARKDMPTIEVRFREWRANRIAQFETRRTEYSVMKRALLASAEDSQRKRMLERDLTDALLNYVDKKYSLAESQFEQVLADYQQWFSNFESLYFYRAEGKYARLLYDQAYEDYLALLQRYPATQYKADVYLRLLTIAQTLDKPNEFANHYIDFQNQGSNFSEKMRNRIHYLAGYYNLQQSNTAAARKSLNRILKGSEYYFPGRYLLGIGESRTANYKQAMRLFSEVANSAQLPWSDPVMPVIQNNALLKLGFILYELGDYKAALAQFEQVSRGVENRDQVLIGKAWTRLKDGQLDGSIDEVNELFRSFLSSQYSYEALVLSAHCKRLLSQPDAAMKDLRYVTTARGVLELADRYHDERSKTLEQMDELERMESQTLDFQDEHLYTIVSTLKGDLSKRLLNMVGNTGAGSVLLQEFARERSEIYTQIQELDNIIDAARKLGSEDVIADAVRRRARLVKALSTYQGDKAIENVNYFLEYPLAVRESVSKYRRHIIQNLVRDMEVEKKRIINTLETARRLESQSSAASSKIDLMALEGDLRNLQNRIDRFQTWLSTNQVNEVQTDFDRWADFSGFGLSDMMVKSLRQREETISQYSLNLASINSLITRRQEELIERLSGFDKDIDKIREDLEAEQLRLLKLEHEKIFDKYYFEKSTSEWQKPASGIDHE